MKMIKELPNLNWTERAKKQLEMTGKELVEQSQVAFTLRDKVVVGLIYQNLFAPPWLWFLLAQGASFRELVDLRNSRDMIPVGTKTAVEADDDLALRFATYYGFTNLNEVIEFQGTDYFLMEKK